MPATIRDVAKKANVGVGTVSRVLNESPSVSEETRQKVLAAIEQLNFSPNPIARQLSTGKTLTIGVILPHLTMPSYVERLRGVQSALADTKYDLVLFCVENPQQRDTYFNDLSLTTRVDGILIISLPPNDAQANLLAASSIPTVLIDAYHPKLYSIVTDDFLGGKIATQHLINFGHRKIAFLGDYLETPFHPSLKYRFKGYREALDDAGIPFNPIYHLEGENERNAARAMGRKILGLDNPPTAIFAGCDSQAVGILDAARELGVKIPHDLSVIGYDGIRDAEYLELTTIEQHLFESGIKGANLLLSTLETGKLDPKRDYISTDLVIRKTTSQIG
jgi:DNA-binding LacI/PurR family transcriptional regulator